MPNYECRPEWPLDLQLAEDARFCSACWVELLEAKLHRAEPEEFDHLYDLLLKAKQDEARDTRAVANRKLDFETRRRR